MDTRRLDDRRIEARRIEIERRKKRNAKKRRMQAIVLISSAVLLAAAGFGIIIYNAIPQPHPQNNQNLAGNTGGNLLNSGLFCEANGLVYFANSFDGGSLYVMNPNETEIKKLGDFNAFSLNVGGDYIYFLQGAPNVASALRVNPGIYRSRTSGKDVVILWGKAAHSMTLCGNDLFYQYHDANIITLYKRLFAISTAGENNRQISTEIINPSSYVNGEIYYSRTETDHSIYSLNVRSGYSLMIAEGNTYNALYDNGYVYYMNQNDNYRLCRYSLADGTYETLTSERVECYNISNGVIFFQNLSTDNPAIFRMNADGSDLIMVRAGVHTKINLTSQYAYFQVYGEDTITYKAELYGSPSAGLFTAGANAVR
jgi:hypothetical protein